MTRRSPTFVNVRIALALGAAALTLVLPASAAAGVTVWFEKDGEPVSAARGGVTIERAVRALLAGPTAAERARGVRSAIPAGTPLRDLSIQHRIVTVDLGARFAAGRSEASLRGRVGQLVRTLRAVPGVRAVRVLVEGGVPVGLFPGYDLRRPVSAAVEPVTRASVSARRCGSCSSTSASWTTRAFPARTRPRSPRPCSASRSGRACRATAYSAPPPSRRSNGRSRPQPARAALGHRIEVQLGRQLALLIENDKVVRTVHISSGAGGATPQGSFRVYRKERYSWSVPFKVWLPWASYFTGGIAFHEFGSVPTYAASHGCVRVNHYDAPLLYQFASFGTPVDVFYEGV